MAIDAEPQAIEAFAKPGSCILVTVTEAVGSTPRVGDTQMLVHEDGVLGTIGGGQLEYLAIDTARVMLANGTDNRDITVPLGPEIGQCCGGRVTIRLTQMTEAMLQSMIETKKTELSHQPQVLIFGAGHVGRALARAMLPLPVNSLLIDSRADELALTDTGIPTRNTPLPEALARDAPAGSAYVILTHDHALDFIITQEALKRSDAAYVGMIGSKTKRATFASWLKSQGSDISSLDRLVMPIGVSQLNDKRPAVIAAMVAAEIIEAVGTWRNDSINQADHQDAGHAKSPASPTVK